MQPGENQIPGTATDWNTVQNFVALRSPDAQIVLASDEIPLMQFGGINTGRYDHGGKAGDTADLLLGPEQLLDHQFPGEPGGGNVLELRSHVRSAIQATPSPTRFGWGARVPFVSRVLPKANAASAQPGTRSAWPFAPSSLLLVSTRPAKEGDDPSSS